MEELIKQLNDLKITQTSIDWLEDLPDDIWKLYFEEDLNPTAVATGLDIDKRRWYETGVNVYEMNGEFLGVRFVQDLFSEQSSVSDIYHTLEFFEMEEIQTISYRQI